MACIVVTTRRDRDLWTRSGLDAELSSRLQIIITIIISVVVLWCHIFYFHYKNQ